MNVLLHTGWNTGRLYKEEGQPIKAWLVELDVYTAAIYFVDRARCVNGLIEVRSPHLFMHEDQVKDHTMYMYDRYQHSYMVIGQDKEHYQYHIHEVAKFLGDDAKL